ncbi:MAG: DUF4136 domain-containing protein [Cyclobacteriaceae bacterium]|nr:DUF4136 domain-containing protein [Cyclobacteriaceae bacterium]
MKKILILLPMLGLLMSNCAVNVKTVYDHQADFKKYKTFCWMEGCEFKFTGPSYVQDSAARENIKQAIIDELKSKGITQSDNNPDLLIGFTITIKDEQAILYHPSSTPDRPFYAPLENDGEVINYLKGTMVIGMADREKSKVVWESFAVRYMEMNPDFSIKKVKKGIHYILRDFPPKPTP